MSWTSEGEWVCLEPRQRPEGWDTRRRAGTRRRSCSICTQILKKIFKYFIKNKCRFYRIMCKPTSLFTTFPIHALKCKKKTFLQDRKSFCALTLLKYTCNPMSLNVYYRLRRNVSLVADFRILVVEESVGPVALGVQARLRLLCTSCIFSSICAKKFTA